MIGIDVEDSENLPKSFIEFPTRWRHVDSAYNDFVRDFRPDSSLSYTAAASNLLAQHGVTRPVKFLPNPAHQDKLTEWIEYLAFECAAHSWFQSNVEAHQPANDKTWKKLVNEGELEPHETEEYVHNRPARSSTLVSAKSRLDEAKRALEVVQRRNNLSWEFIHATADFDDWKREC
ncbi:hypothetical protein N0V88_002175 [Collariella sp. IMI 366227]|nr:hypothetical protein N0V88_002175 [Collariella sp. IMI 366227]